MSVFIIAEAGINRSRNLDQHDAYKFARDAEKWARRIKTRAEAHRVLRSLGIDPDTGVVT